MVEPLNAELDRYGVIVISDNDIERFAYRQLRDFRSGYFDSPGPLPIDEFVENYLGIDVFYCGLSLDGSVFGATALNDGAFPILDSYGSVTLKTTTKGNIFIDESACKRMTTLAFTLAHEAGHSQFDTNVNFKRLELNDTVVDTVSDLFGQLPTSRIRTARDWMEHHANRYAVYLLMPKPFVRKLWAVWRSEFFSGKRVTASKPKRLWLVINHIANDLGVAQISIAYRLRELNLISENQFASLEIGNKNIH